MTKVVVWMAVVASLLAACCKSTLPKSPGGLVINELMIDPVGANADHQWIEIANVGSSPVDLAGWTIATKAASVPLSGFVAPGGFQVVNLPGEQLGDETGEVALYKCAPSAECIVDYVAYRFDGAPAPSPAEGHAVAAKIWTAGAAVEEGLLLEEGESLGRDRHMHDTNTPRDWAGFGGIEATGATSGAENFGELAFELQNGDACKQKGQKPTDAQQEKLLAALKQIREQHMDLFGGMDPGMGPGVPQVQPNGDIVIGGIRLRWGTRLNPDPEGRNALGRACPPETPDGEIIVLIDRTKVNELWALKEVLLHELVHAALFRKTDSGYWRNINGTWRDSQIRELVNPFHEVFAYLANLRLLERLITEFPDKADAIRKRMVAKVRFVCEKADEALRNRGRLSGNPLWKPLLDMFDAKRAEIMRWKRWAAMRDGKISRTERASLIRAGQALGLSEAEIREYLE